MKAINSTLCEQASAHILDSIMRKRVGGILAPPEIEKIIMDFLAGKIPDYQMSAWLATIACMGMNIEEIESLTHAYISEGKSLNLVGINGKVVDKHSTGGVGDKTTLAVIPIVAACGVPVAKLSGRGLGYAGGTLDKLESIRGIKLDLDAKEARNILDKVGMVIAGQSAELAPGDKATYQLRDVTGSVESIPLIAASIISKKVAVKADGLILDVKTGTGALIQDHAKAFNLAETMVELAKRFGMNCHAIISDMNQPLGYAVGNALEVKEAISVLCGENIPGLTELCFVLACSMLQAADPLLSDIDARKQVDEVISNGSAYEQFIKWACTQGADIDKQTNTIALPIAPKQITIHAQSSGWIRSIDPRTIGNATLRIGAGRLVQSTQIDHSAGIILHKRVGDKITQGETLAEIHYTDGDITTASAMTASAFTIDTDYFSPLPIVHQILRPN